MPVTPEADGQRNCTDIERDRQYDLGSWALPLLHERDAACLGQESTVANSRGSREGWTRPENIETTNNHHNNEGREFFWSMQRPVCSSFHAEQLVSDEPG